MKGMFSILGLLAVNAQALFPGCVRIPNAFGQPQLVCNPPLPMVPIQPHFNPPTYVVDEAIKWNNQFITNEQAWFHNNQNAAFQYNENALRFWWGNNNPYVDRFVNNQREWKDYFQTIDENMLEGYKEHVENNKWFG